MADGAICDMREAPDRRVRRRCPLDKRLCYGQLAEYYDTRRVFFDCGTVLDYGYGYWTKPPKPPGSKKR
jgi:hypothetical protein